MIFSDGATGTGSAPCGQTPSIYEGTVSGLPDHEKITGLLLADERLKVDISQEDFDNVLAAHCQALGRGNMYALSLAFFAATAEALGINRRAVLERFRHTQSPRARRRPRFLFNILNGGSHAYTNPVLSDFTEYLLVPREENLETDLAAFRAVNLRVREELVRLPTCKIGDNAVHYRMANSNHAWIEFLADILEKEGLARHFDLMIDASAGRLMRDNNYHLPITKGGVFNPESFCEYWKDLLSDYPIAIVEDPFAENDTKTWQALTAAVPDRIVAGDDLCATNANRILDGIEDNTMSAVLIKPDQAGTVSATVDALNTAGSRGLPMIPSHRSIETGHTFLSDICSVYAVECVKIGLLSDFETLLKLNQIIRYFDQTYDQDNNRTTCPDGI